MPKQITRSDYYEVSDKGYIRHQKIKFYLHQRMQYQDKFPEQSNNDEAYQIRQSNENHSSNNNGRHQNNHGEEPSQQINQTHQFEQLGDSKKTNIGSIQNQVSKQTVTQGKTKAQTQNGISTDKIKSISHIFRSLEQQQNLVKRFKSLRSQVDEDLIAKVEYMQPDRYERLEQISYMGSPSKNIKTKQYKSNNHKYKYQNERDITAHNSIEKEKRLSKSLHKGQHRELRQNSRGHKIKQQIRAQIELLNNRLNRFEGELVKSEQRTISYKLQRQLIERDNELKRLQRQNQILVLKTKCLTEIAPKKGQDNLMNFLEKKIMFFVTFLVVFFVCILLTKPNKSCKH